MLPDQQKRPWEKYSVIGFWIGVATIVVFALASIYRGQAKLIGKGFDPDNITCGLDEMADYPFAYFVNPAREFVHRVVCVKQCPRIGPKGEVPGIECLPNSEVPKCDQFISVLDPSKTVLIYDSFPYRNNVCIPRTLDYYTAIKDYSIPTKAQQIVQDLLQTFGLMIFIPVVSVVFCWAILHFLRSHTQGVVWFIAFGVLTLLGSLGIYFALEWKEAKDMNLDQKQVGVFRVSEHYIQSLVNEPGVMQKFFLSMFFTFATLYGGYFFYQNNKRVDEIVVIFEYVEEFLYGKREEKEDQQQSQKSQNQMNGELQIFMIAAAIVFNIVLLLAIRLVIQFGSCYWVKDLERMGPFQHLQEGPLFYLQFLIYPIIFWLFNVYFGFLNLFISLAFKNYIYYDDKNQELLLSTIRIQPQLSKQSIMPSQKAVIMELRHNFQLVFQIYPSVVLTSFYLLQQPVKFIADIARDSARKFRHKPYYQKIEKWLCFPCFKYYSWFRDVEDVLYAEIALDHKLTVQEARKNLRENLNMNSDEELEVEIYEEIRNSGDFFMLSVKLLIALMSGSVARYICSLLFAKGLYSLNAPTVVAAVIGYYTASIYFQVYSITVPTLGYLYLRQQRLAQAGGKQQERATHIKEKFQGVEKICGKHERKLKIRGNQSLIGQ